MVMLTAAGLRYQIAVRTRTSAGLACPALEIVPTIAALTMAAPSAAGLTYQNTIGACTCVSRT